jgi:superfamily I DNA/RNA helicase
MNIEKEKLDIINALQLGSCYQIVGKAGTGKTTLGCLIGNKFCTLISTQQKVLYLTYSNYAKYQIRHVIEKLHNNNLLHLDFKKKVIVSNYHSFWWELINEYKGFLVLQNNINLLTKSELNTWIVNTIDSLDKEQIDSFFLTKQNKINENNKHFLFDLLSGLAIIFKKWDVKNFGSKFSSLKLSNNFLNLLSDKIIERNMEGNFYHDETIYWIYILILKHPNLLNILRFRFPVIIIDEFQDTDIAQWNIIKMINPLTLITTGDTEQTIHIWRGADLKRFSQFEEFGVSNYSKYEKFEIETLFRSEIDFSATDNWNMKKLNVTINDNISFMGAKKYSNIVLKYTVLSIMKKSPRATISILCLTNSQANDITKFLRSKYITKKGNELPHLSCSRLGTNNSPFDVACEILFSLIESDISVSLIANDLINMIYSPIKLESEAKKSSRRDDLKSRWNISELIYHDLCNDDYNKGLHKFIDLCLHTASQNNIYFDYVIIKSMKFVKKKLMMFSKFKWSQLQSEEKKRKISNYLLQFEHIIADNYYSKLQVMTIHQSKGREFDFVIIPWVSDLPWDNWNFGLSWDLTNTEQSKLFYTACTRAKQGVYIFYPKDNFATIN